MDPVNRIRLDDLISDEVSHILEVTSGSKFSFKECPSLDKESFTRRVRTYDAVCEGLIAMAAVGGRWAEEWHYPIWRKALTRLGSVSEVGCGHSGNGVWHSLKRYPATLLLYSLGISALPTGDRGVSLLSLLLSTELQGEGQGDTKAVEVLPPIFLFRGQQTELSGLLDGMEGRELPINEWLLRLLPPFFGDYFVSEDKFQYWFDRLEVLIAINFLSSNLDDRMGGALPFGLFAWQDVFFPLKRLSPHTQEIDDVLAADGEKSVYVAGGFLGRSVNEVCDSLKKLKDRVEDTSRF